MLAQERTLRVLVVLNQVLHTFRRGAVLQEPKKIELVGVNVIELVPGFLKRIDLGLRLFLRLLGCQRTDTSYPPFHRRNEDLTKRLTGFIQCRHAVFAFKRDAEHFGNGIDEFSPEILASKRHGHFDSRKA